MAFSNCGIDLQAWSKEVDRGNRDEPSLMHRPMQAAPVPFLTAVTSGHCPLCSGAARHRPRAAR